MILLTLFVTVALLGMASIMISNLTLFPRLDHPAPLMDRWLLAILRTPGKVRLWPVSDRASARATAGSFCGVVSRPPRVSVLVPARNEAAVICGTVGRLLGQDYPCFELIVLDDHSTDGTGDLARAAGRSDPRLRVLSGAGLPRGWAGKNWACHQLAQAATGELLVFTDADTLWRQGGLAAVMAEQARTDADLLTVWPTQITETWAERLVVPLMGMVVLGYLPVFLTHLAPWSAFAAANGQCLAFRRNAYAAIGGHAALRGEVLEDVKFARRIKQAGLRLRMADGDNLIACRMYTGGWPAVRDGFAKNILAGYGNSLFMLALATVFHWLLFLYPPAWLVLAGRKRAWGCKPQADTGSVPRHTGSRRTGNLLAAGLACQPAVSTAGVSPWWPLALTALGVTLRAVSAAFTRQRVRDALFMPVSALLMTAISARAVWWRVRYGGPHWKGRVIKTEPDGAV